MAKSGHPRGITNTRRPEIKKAKAEIFAELQIKGIPVEDIAKSYNLTERQVRRITTWGAENGVIDNVRNRMLKQLEKVPNIYEAILDADPLHDANTEDVRKLRELQLKAARDLGRGFLFKKDDVQITRTETVSLEDFHKLRAARAGKVIDVNEEPPPLPERTGLPAPSDGEG